MFDRDILDLSLVAQFIIRTFGKRMLSLESGNLIVIYRFHGVRYLGEIRELERE